MQRLRTHVICLSVKLAAIPKGRIREIDEVENAVLFLASDEASYITGAEIAVDDGFLAQ